MSESTEPLFDPESVERLVIADEYTHCPEPNYEHGEEVVVRASDYSKLLSLYREARRILADVRESTWDGTDRAKRIDAL